MVWTHVAPCSDPAALAGTTLMFDAAKHTRHVFSAVNADAARGDAIGETDSNSSRYKRAHLDQNKLCQIL